jgi:hypothetical protein
MPHVRIRGGGHEQSSIPTPTQMWVSYPEAGRLPQYPCSAPRAWAEASGHRPDGHGLQPRGPARAPALRRAHERGTRRAWFRESRPPGQARGQLAAPQRGIRSAKVRRSVGSCTASTSTGWWRRSRDRVAGELPGLVIASWAPRSDFGTCTFPFSTRRRPDEGRETSSQKQRTNDGRIYAPDVAGGAADERGLALELAPCVLPRESAASSFRRGRWRPTVQGMPGT